MNTSFIRMPAIAQAITNTMGESPENAEKMNTAIYMMRVGRSTTAYFTILMMAFTMRTQTATLMPARASCT